MATETYARARSHRMRWAVVGNLALHINKDMLYFFLVHSVDTHNIALQSTGISIHTTEFLFSISLEKY